MTDDTDNTDPPDDPPILDPIQRLHRDLKQAAKTLSTAEARYLVDAYYQMQRDRIRAAHQVRTLSEGGEPHDTLTWLGTNADILERDIKRALDSYSDSHISGVWAKSIKGIGPVIAAGLLAHIDLEPWVCLVARADPTHKAKPCKPTDPHGPGCHFDRIETAGRIWRFAGLDPTVRWEKNTRRPWNGALKRLCWIIGESFTKVSIYDDDVYGKLYLQRKAIEIARNEAGEFVEQAKASLASKRWTKETQTRQHYEAGRLPPVRIHLRAQRWAVKIFLSHYHAVAYYARYQTRAPVPFAIGIQGHTDAIPVPNWPFD